ncbi:MAG: hypothetical protein IKJ59_02020, partial [Clostridia bacterium]|nr:hypothetical protein [Clostridia bacterium]
MTYNYKYDGFGNIKECRHGSVIVENSFDSCNRLTINSVQPGDTVIVTEPIYERNSAGEIYPDNAVTGVNLSGFFSVNLTR